MADPGELLSQFMRALSAQPTPGLPRRMCAAFAHVVGADGAAIALGSSEGERSLLAATDKRTEQIEDLQDMLGEGPSLRALIGDGPAILRASDDAQAAWPILTSSLADHSAFHGVLALYAFPMQPQQQVLGVLTVVQTRRPDLRVSLEEAQLLANAVGVAVLGDVWSDDATESRWLERDRVSQATGMVIAQLGVSPADAVAVLRAHAYAMDVTLSEVSRHVVDRSLRFTINPEERS